MNVPHYASLFTLFRRWMCNRCELIGDIDLGITLRLFCRVMLIIWNSQRQETLSSSGRLIDCVKASSGLFATIFSESVG
jgi:hypothetical protein